MRILVITLGSIGDLMPFLAVAEALRRRGHEVIIAGQAGYAALVQRAGFGFGVIWNGTPADIDAALEQSPQQAWDQVHHDLLLPAMEPTAAFIRHAAKSGDCVVLASWSAFGATAACARMNLPLYRACLSPHAVNEATATGDAHADRWLGFFPDWFGPPGAGWPDIALAGFPALDDSLVPALEPKLENFLDAGPAPVVFTPGSFQRRSSRFFRESLAACRALGLRAVLLTPYAEQVPANLPDSVMHLAYAPLHRLAPRAAALVHHGGIGTLSQGLRSGVPQVCAPVFFDQFDNAARLEGLGVSRTLALRDYAASALVPLLESVRGDRQTQEQCRAIRNRMTDGDPTDHICALIGAATVSPAGPV
jgi:UDP:flavonoid glycosyltransferase YjiC (YdhE family)